jgi:hypothetical protein
MGLIFRLIFSGVSQKRVYRVSELKFRDVRGGLIKKEQNDVLVSIGWKRLNN